MTRAEGISDRVDDWLAANITNATPPFNYTMIAGGHSNITYRVDDSVGHAFVLRRPPLGHRLAGAHDMGREYRLISSLAATDVPVAPALGICTDESVNELPFYVMKFVDGHVVRDIDTAMRVLTPAARRAASESLVDTMVALHDVDPDAVGLGDLGKREEYIARQLKRWYGNFQAQQTRELPLVDEVHDELVRRIPPQVGCAIVHGDYRLDNVMVNEAGQVIAVLDWEICTLGDPLADLGMLMTYYNGPGDEVSAWDNNTCTAEGFLNRRELVERYGRASGRDVSLIDYYYAFGNWKLACIVEGVYARYRGGALGARTAEELEPFRRRVDDASQLAARVLESIA